MYGTYLLFTATLSKPELYAGLGAAVVATVAAHVFGIAGVLHFRPALRDVLQAWRLPWSTVRGTYQLLKSLVRQAARPQGAPSVIRALPYRVGKMRNAPDAARRALAEIYTTITPNSIVLGIVPRQHVLLYHQILPGDVLQMTINLGAMP